MSESSLQLEQLIQRARCGDNVARGEIWIQYSHYLNLLARLNLGRKIRTKVSHSDVVQETFLQADKNLANFRGTTEKELMAWLRKILATQIAQHVRRYDSQKRDVDLEQTVADQLDRSSEHFTAWLADSASSPSMRAARRERESLLADCLAQMKPAHREVIILHSLEDLSFEEVGARMDRSTDAVKKLWVRALTKLRAALRDQGTV